MPGPSFTKSKKGGGVLPLGKRNLEDLATKFLQNAYPTFHKLVTDRVTHRPTSVAVYGITATKTGSDPRLSTPLAQLTLGDVIGLLGQFSFQIDTYLSGTKIKGDSHVLKGESPNPGEALANKRSFTTKLSQLSLLDIVELLPQATFSLNSKSYIISGGVENDVEDEAKKNPHLKTSVATLTPKYLLILARFFRFTSMPANPGHGTTGIVAFNKVFGE